MKINLFLIPFIIMLGLLLSANDNRKNRLLYIIISSAVLIFVAAMRSPEWMTLTYNIDSLNYKNSFGEYSDLSWDKIWSLAHQRYFGGEEEDDVGFIVLIKIIGWVTHDFHIYSLLVDLIFFIPLGVILYRYCTSMRQIIFAFVFYIALVQIFLLGGGRQIFALGFDMMALIAIIDRKRLWTVIFFLVGVTIHFSSLLFVIPLLMIWLGIAPKTLKVIHLILFLLFPIVLLFPNQLIAIMGNLVGMEKYAAYAEGEIRGGATTFIVLIELLSLFCLFTIKRSSMIENDNIRYFYVMAPLFTIFAPLIISNGTMIRISLYFHLFIMLLVPFGLDSFFKENNKTAYFVTISLLVLFALIGGGTRYYFYWQV